MAESLEQLALEVFEDGCINETLAALEAESSQQTAEISEVQRVVAKLAEDEANHAELAWRTLSWVCSQLGASALVPLKASLKRRMKQANAQLPAQREYQPSAMERRHGQFSMEERQRLHRQTLQTVIAPCLEQLERSLRSAAAAPCSPSHFAHSLQA